MSPSEAAHKDLKIVRRAGKRHAWTEIEDLGGDRFYLEHPDILKHGWIYGGDLASQSLFCAYQTVRTGMRVTSFHSYFCSPGLAKPLDFSIQRFRDTLYRAWRRVEVRQVGELIYHAEFMFREVKPQSGHNSTKSTMIKESESPNVPRPSELLTSYEHYKLLKASNFDMRFVRGVAFPSDFPNLDHRPCDGEKFLYGHDEPAMTQSLWVKYLLENFKNDPHFIDLIVVYLTDLGVCFAGCLPFPRRTFQKIASIDLSAWIHLHEGIDPHKYFLYETKCMNHVNKVALNLGKLWTIDGQLVVTAVQEAISAPNLGDNKL